MKFRVLMCMTAVMAFTACASEEPEEAPEEVASDTSAINEVEEVDPEAAPEESFEETDPDPAAADIQTEGSVTTEDGSFVEYPDGLIVRPVSLEQVPNEWGSYASESDVLVRVTLSLENAGTEPVQIEPISMKMGLMYGPNWMDAEQDPGYMIEEGQEEQALSSEDPNRVGSGETVEVFSTFVVPEDDLDELAIEATIAMDRYTPFVFTDAETLLTPS